MKRKEITECLMDFDECVGVDAEEVLRRLSVLIEDAKKYFGDDLLSIKCIRYGSWDSASVGIEVKFVESEGAYEKRKREAEEAKQRSIEKEIEEARRVLERYGAK